MPEETFTEELLNKIEEAAHRYEEEFHGCSRCVFKALQDHLDLGDGATLQASTPLSPGLSRDQTLSPLFLSRQNWG